MRPGAVDSGSFGVGAVLVDGAGAVAAVGHNEMFVPRFRSDRHAEMVVMNAFEDGGTEPSNLAAHTLYSSLEPCPMCLVRLSSSGIGTVLYAAADAEGGMVTRRGNLPPLWRDLAGGKRFERARCSGALADAARRILQINLEALLARIKAS